MEAKRLKRTEEEEKRKRKHEIESKQQFATGQLSSDYSSSPPESASEDDVATHKATKCRKVIRKEFYTPRLLAVLEKCKDTERNAVHILSATAIALGHSLDSLILSRSSLVKYRKMNRKKIAEERQKNYHVI